MLDATVSDPVVGTVVNPDAWFPDVELGTWQELYRVPGTAPQVMERQVLLAMADCNRTLATWKAALLEDAVAAGDPVPTELPAEYVTDYEEAVYARAFALLIPLLPSIVTDERAAENLEPLAQEPGDYYDRSSARLARIMGEHNGLGRIKGTVI